MRAIVFPIGSVRLVISAAELLEMIKVGKKPTSAAIRGPERELIQMFSTRRSWPHEGSRLSRLFDELRMYQLASTLIRDQAGSLRA